MLTLGTFRVRLEREILRARRYRRPLSIALIDIDGFRQVKLNHGYPTGDRNAGDPKVPEALVGFLYGRRQTGATGM